MCCLSHQICGDLLWQQQKNSICNLDIKIWQRHYEKVKYQANLIYEHKFCTKKKLTNEIQKYIKREKHYDQVVFMPGMRGCLKINQYNSPH